MSEFDRRLRRFRKYADVWHGPYVIYQPTTTVGAWRNAKQHVDIIRGKFQWISSFLQAFISTYYLVYFYRGRAG